MDVGEDHVRVGAFEGSVGAFVAGASEVAAPVSQAGILGWRGGVVVVRGLRRLSQHLSQLADVVDGRTERLHLKKREDTFGFHLHLKIS